jgi:hypothetical protein
MSLVEVFSETVLPWCMGLGPKMNLTFDFSYIVGLYVLFFVSSPQCETKSCNLSKQIYILKKKSDKSLGMNAYYHLLWKL